MAKSVEELRAEYDALHRRTTPEAVTTSEMGPTLDPPATLAEMAWHRERCAGCQGGECLRSDVYVMRAFGEYMGQHHARLMGYPEPERFPVRG